MSSPLFCFLSVSESTSVTTDQSSIFDWLNDSLMIHSRRKKGRKLSKLRARGRSNLGNALKKGCFRKTLLYHISVLHFIVIWVHNQRRDQWTITKIVGFPKPLFVFDSLPTGEGVQTRPGWPGWVCEMEWAMDSMNYDTLSQKTSGKCAKVWLTNRSLGNWSGLVWWSWSRYSVGRRCKDW